MPERRVVAATATATEADVASAPSLGEPDDTEQPAPSIGPPRQPAASSDTAGDPDLGIAGDAERPDEPLVADPPGGQVHLWAVVMVFDLAVDLPTPYARVSLREVDEPHRILAIPIGLPEGTALAHAWRGVPTPRPLTHELFSEVVTRLGATIEVVRLIGRQAGIVLAEMELSTARGREVVACRPTDALTLAVRQGVPAPILVDPRLFAEEGDVDPAG